MNISGIQDLRYAVYCKALENKKISAVFTSQYGAEKFGQTFWSRSGFIILDLETNEPVYDFDGAKEATFKCFRCDGYGSINVYSGRFSRATCQVCHGQGVIIAEVHKIWSAYKRAETRYSAVRWSSPTGDPIIEKRRKSYEKARAKLVEVVATDDF